MKLLLAKSTRAVVLALRELQVGATLLHLGSIDRRVEPNQRGALGDALPFLELNRADAAGDLGPHGDRFVRAETAHRGDRLRHRLQRDLDCFDRDARRRRAGACSPFAARRPRRGQPYDPRCSRRTKSRPAAATAIPHRGDNTEDRLVHSFVDFPVAMSGAGGRAAGRFTSKCLSVRFVTQKRHTGRSYLLPPSAACLAVDRSNMSLDTSIKHRMNDYALLGRSRANAVRQRRFATRKRC